MSRSRNWAFTSFAVDPPTFDIERHVCAVWQREQAPETGRLHWQGFAKFKNPVSRSAAQDILGLSREAHLEKAIHPKASYEYCRKEDTRVQGPYIYPLGFCWEDDVKGQGKRTDLSGVADSIREGLSVPAIAERHPESFIKYTRGIAALHAALRGGRRDGTRMPTIYYLHGAPGTGKTRWVYDTFGVDAIYQKTAADKWWDGYEGQRVILIDEFDGGIPIGDLLQVCDRYPYRADCKGGHVQLSNASEFIVFTANDLPESLAWARLPRPNQFAAFRRRVRRFIDFDRSDVRQLLSSLVFTGSGGSPPASPRASERGDVEFVPETPAAAFSPIPTEPFDYPGVDQERPPSLFDLDLPTVGSQQYPFIIDA